MPHHPAPSDATPEAVLRGYFRAKDDNRPHVLSRVFEPDAELVVVNHSSSIAFPARTVGREAIGDVLVRDFAQAYENVHSFYLQRPPPGAEEFSCAWLVAMSEKRTRCARVGCGRYDWKFSKDPPHLARHLTITIDAMQVLPPGELPSVLAWVQGLSYPWCTAQEAMRAAPRSDLLAPVVQYLATCTPGGQAGAVPGQPPPATIRRAVEDDAAPLAELAERTFRDTFAPVNRAEDMEAHCRKHYGREIQAAEIRDPDRATLVCEVEGRLVGYGQLRWQGAPACVRASRPAEIQRLYVDADWHGRGIAQALMASLLDAAVAGGADVAWLGMWEKNPRAISFYAKSGFPVVGEHVFVLGSDPQRDLVLARRLC